MALDETSVGGRFAIGAGKAGQDAVDAIKQLYYKLRRDEGAYRALQADRADRNRLYQQGLGDSTAAMLGELAGNIGVGVAVPGGAAATLGRVGVSGAAGSLLTPVDGDGSFVGQKARQAAEGALFATGQKIATDQVKKAAPQVRKIFAGEKAAGANLLQKAEAESMLAAGKSPEEVWKATGWAKGPEGKWRWEIPDNAAQIRRAASPTEPMSAAFGRNALDSTSPGPMRFGEIVDHPELFKAYPQIAEQPIHLLPRSTPQNVRAGYAQETGQFFVNPNIDAQQARSSLLHEAQHAVQMREGFAAGANPKEFLQDAAELRNANLQKLNVAFEDAVARGDLNGARTLDDAIRREQATQRVADYQFDLYRRAPGEVEARNVQTRADWDPMFRRGVPPAASQDVKPEQLFQRGGYIPADMALDASPAPRRFTLDELAAEGDKVGVRVRPTPDQEVRDPVTGRVWQIPGGLEGNFSYGDVINLKSRGINPNDMSPELHAQLQQKMARTMTPERGDDVDLFNRYAMGMLSPNQPLTPNEFAVSAMRARTPEDIDRIAGFASWAPGEKRPAGERWGVSRDMTNAFGVQASDRGGLGVSGSQDWSNLAEFAKAFRQNPDFFRKQDGESWADHVERVMNQTRGLSSKTGSFSAVWQDPANAGISAIDRHMARSFAPTLMDGPQGPGLKANWKDLWNDQVDRLRALQKDLRAGKISETEFTELTKVMPPVGARKVRRYDEILTQTGGDDWQSDQVIRAVSSPREMVTMNARTGAPNPAVPPHLQNLPFYTPDKVAVMPPIYRDALRVNEQLAKGQGLETFPSQWMLWDRIRGRLEPHEVMYPGLHKLPPISPEQRAEALAEHTRAGYLSGTDQTTGKLRPVGTMDPNKALYWGAAGAAVGVPMLMDYLQQQNEGMY